MNKSIEDYIKELLEYKKRSTNQDITAPIEKNPSNLTGKLIVSVTHAQNVFPIENARIDIYNSAGELFTTQYTDSSGQTSLITLPTVSKENSEEADNTEKVADNYFLTVTADDYVTTRVENIPIFEGVTTSLPVDMTFLPASDSGNNQTVVLSNDDRG